LPDPEYIEKPDSSVAGGSGKAGEIGMIVGLGMIVGDIVAVGCDAPIAPQFTSMQSESIQTAAKAIL